MPVSVPKVTTTPGTAAFVALSAVTVTVVPVELSEGTVAGAAESVSSAAVGPVVVVVVVVGVPPAPQPVNKTVKAATVKAARDFMCFV
jgi:hypothetical protein